ncbi:MAG: hypothetical protein D6731_03130, partial [Planctomycetota bacterium]
PDGLRRPPLGHDGQPSGPDEPRHEPGRAAAADLTPPVALRLVKTIQGYVPRLLRDVDEAEAFLAKEWPPLAALGRTPGERAAVQAFHDVARTALDGLRRRSAGDPDAVFVPSREALANFPPRAPAELRRLGRFLRELGEIVARTREALTGEVSLSGTQLEFALPYLHAPPHPRGERGGPSVGLRAATERLKMAFERVEHAARRGEPRAVACLLLSLASSLDRYPKGRRTENALRVLRHSAPWIRKTAVGHALAAELQDMLVAAGHLLGEEPLPGEEPRPGKAERPSFGSALFAAVLDRLRSESEPSAFLVSRLPPLDEDGARPSVEARGVLITYEGQPGLGSSATCLEACWPDSSPVEVRLERRALRVGKERAKLANGFWKGGAVVLVEALPWGLRIRAWNFQGRSAHCSFRAASALPREVTFRLEREGSGVEQAHAVVALTPGDEANRLLRRGPAEPFPGGGRSPGAAEGDGPRQGPGGRRRRRRWRR